MSATQPDETGGINTETGLPAVSARIETQTCNSCGTCMAVCPSEAIGYGDNGFYVKADACCGCGACADVCPTGAVVLG